MNAGIKTCWFNPSNQPVPPGYRIDYIIHDLRGLESIIFGA
jgi:FMN phosphatase YigB (HAD superfamily)